MSVRMALKVHIAHGPDGIAQIAQIVARENIHVEALAAVSSDDATTIDLLPTNPEKALKALQQAGLQGASYRVALAWMPRQPGSLLLACETLAAADVRVDAAYILTADRHNGQRVAFACSDVDRADQLLWALSY
jgi:hypothetical protein